MKSAAIFLILLLPPTSHARTGPVPKVLGWTADGLKFAYVAPPEEVGMGETEATGDVTYGVVIDGRTGIVQNYFLRSSGEVPPEDKKQFKALPQKADWEAFVKANALSCQSGDADAQIKGKGVTGKWRKQSFEFSFGGDEMAEEKKASFTMSVKGKGASAILSVSSPMASAGGGLSGRVRGCFGKRRVAWILERNPGMMRDPGDYSVEVGPLEGPRIQLVADGAILHQAAEKVGAALEAAGIVSTSTKASNEKTPRPATVIYAATGFEAQAQKVAQAVPGGATVAKLDWKAPFEIIVGIGATAMK